MKFPENFNFENLFKFYQTLIKNYGEVISHIKFPEYSISIPNNKDEFNELIEEIGWNNIYYISLFVKPKILIKFEFLKEEIDIKCDPSELEKEVEDLIKQNF